MFAGLLENAIEMADQDPSIVAPIGECFEDMTEVLNELYTNNTVISKLSSVGNS